MWLDLKKFDLPKCHHTSRKSSVKVNRSSCVREENKKCWTLYRKQTWILTGKLWTKKAK